MWVCVRVEITIKTCCARFWETESYATWSSSENKWIVINIAWREWCRWVWSSKRCRSSYDIQPGKMTQKKEAKKSSKKGKSTHKGTNYNDESTNVTYSGPTRECKQAKPEAGALDINHSLQNSWKVLAEFLINAFECRNCRQSNCLRQPRLCSQRSNQRDAVRKLLNCVKI